MEKKEIQEKRMRGYFIDATREILKGEGLRSVNVRAVADRAGYSYATLYNYFKDLKELIFICVSDFQAEAEELIQQKTADTPAGKERIKEIMKAFVNYFNQYPGIFELFYLEKMMNVSGKHPVAQLIYSFPDRLTATDWQACIEQGIFKKEEVRIRMKQMNNAMVGMLLLYMNRLHPDSYLEFMKDVEEQISFILR
jgi:AcrR family transcriptional regulator